MKKEANMKTIHLESIRKIDGKPCKVLTMELVVM